MFVLLMRKQWIQAGTLSVDYPWHLAVMQSFPPVYIASEYLDTLMTLLPDAGYVLVPSLPEAAPAPAPAPNPNPPPKPSPYPSLPPSPFNPPPSPALTPATTPIGSAATSPSPTQTPSPAATPTPSPASTPTPKPTASPASPSQSPAATSAPVSVSGLFDLQGAAQGKPCQTVWQLISQDPDLSTWTALLKVNIAKCLQTMTCYLLCIAGSSRLSCCLDACGAAVLRVQVS